MTQLEDTGSASASPWATIWLRPRQTIERIVATRPTYLVLPLAMLGMVAGFYMQLAGLGLAGGLSDWRCAGHRHADRGVAVGCNKERLFGDGQIG